MRRRLPETARMRGPAGRRLAAVAERPVSGSNRKDDRQARQAWLRTLRPWARSPQTAHPEGSGRPAWGPPGAPERPHRISMSGTGPCEDTQQLGGTGGLGGARGSR